MVNSLKCQECRFYDPIVPPKGKRGTHGWCARRSIYPYKEGPGQVFPPGVKRVTNPGDLAKPVIVQAVEVVTHCTHAELKKR